MREIKFRAWVKEERMMFYQQSNDFNHFEGKTKNGDERYGNINGLVQHGAVLMQFTGLHDKNGVQEVYEGDIIDIYGIIKGSIYEMDKGETDLVIEGLGTSAWSKTEKAGLERGLKYAE